MEKNLAAVVANKVGDWVTLSKAVGDRVLENTGDIMAAQFAYLASGMVCGKGKIVLLGVNNTDVSAEGKSLPMSDLRCLCAMRMTEIYEWCLLRGLHPPSSASSQVVEKKSSTSSFSNFFGLGGLSGGSKEIEKENSDEVIISSDHSKSQVPLKKLPPEIVLKCQIALCPYKFKLAILLADFGLTNDAAEYIREIKAISLKINGAGSVNKQSDAKANGAPPRGQSPGIATANNATQSSPNFLSKTFLNALAEFSDRLKGGHCGGGLAGPRSTVQENVGGSSVHNSESSGWGIFSNFITSEKLKVFVGDGLPASTTTSSKPPPGQSNTSSLSATGNGHALSSSSSNIQSLDGGPPLSSRGPPHISGGPPLTSNGPPLVSGGPPLSSGGPPLTSGGPPLTSRGPPVMSGGPPLTSGGPPQTSGGPPHSSELRDQNAADSPKKPIPQKAVVSVPAATTSVTTTVKKSLLSWLYPDAHDTTENMGESNKAYFDKDTGKWVFPDDANNPAPPDPSSLPPPTGPLTSGPPTISATPSQTTSASDYDPLAALMAPPPRSVYKAPVADMNDPLAMMMAPPPVRIGGTSSTNSGPPSTYNIWKPPVPNPFQQQQFAQDPSLQNSNVSSIQPTPSFQATDQPLENSDSYHNSSSTSLNTLSPPPLNQRYDIQQQLQQQQQQQQDSPFHSFSPPPMF